MFSNYRQDENQLNTILDHGIQQIDNGLEQIYTHRSRVRVVLRGVPWGRR